MKLNFHFIFITFLILLLPYCNTPPSNNAQVDDTFYADCIEIIKDEIKCEALIKKREERQNENQTKQIQLTEEQMQGLEIRDSFKNRMMGKSKFAVIHSVGEPDERGTDGSGQEFFYYRKPLTRYSTAHDPDKEIIIVFRREFVTRVIHTPPDSVLKSSIPFLDDTPKKLLK